MTAKKTQKTLHHCIPGASKCLSQSLSNVPYPRRALSIERAKLFLSYSSLFVVNKPAFLETMYEGLKP